MISISATTGNTRGNVILSTGNSTFGKIETRVSRRATLDGGAVITHSGVAQGDRTFEIATEIDQEQKEAIIHIQANSVLVFVSCTEGLFLGAISSIDTSTSTLSMTILIKSKEA